MSQYLSMLPSQQMRLEQRLTPQLIQSMEILQLPLAALEARIRTELESNPVLEESENVTANDAAPKDEPVRNEANDSEAESFDRLDGMARDLELDPGDLAFGRAGSSSGERDVKMDAMANTAARSEGLKEQLIKQWSLTECSPEVKDSGELIIDWMDEDGYLRTEREHHPAAVSGATFDATPLIIKRTNEETDRLMEEIADSRKPPVSEEVLDEGLSLVQTLEPIGVGARDLTECLLIQLDALGDSNPLHAELVREHLVDLAANRFPLVAKKTNQGIEEIKAALKVIGKLNHHPGLLVKPVDIIRISPDILVDYSDDGDGYSVRLARGSSPRLRISQRYRLMLRDKTEDAQAREFIKKRIEAAGALIDAIQYRRARMLEIGKVIVDRQREFFDYGPQFLNVLRMRDLAEEFKCDPSTVSRTVDGKYMQSPRGIYPLRMFFTGGTEDASGASVSWDTVKAKVKEIVDNEDKSNPMHDEKVAKKLAESGVKLSRRTVAKYRSQLDIPSAPQRREY
ncbi:MAG: RNA polymerase factor sigma-54 [Planctomycetota bacterium]|nr:RNA polymerase factor sigma-54 [Planctomycetota bacterium]